MANDRSKRGDWNPKPTKAQRKALGLKTPGQVAKHVRKTAEAHAARKKASGNKKLLNSLGKSAAQSLRVKAAVKKGLSRKPKK